MTARIRIRARLEAVRDRREDGLAILDVLIGVALFVLISIIAATAINQYRARAYESGAVSDVKHVATVIEAAHIDADAYPFSLEDVALTFDAEGGNLTRDNEIVGYVSDGASGFSVCVVHRTGAFAQFDSRAGTIVAKGRSGGIEACGATVEAEEPIAAPTIRAWMVLSSFTADWYLSDGQYDISAQCQGGPCNADQIRALLPAGLTVVGRSPEDGGTAGWIVEASMSAQEVGAALSAASPACRNTNIDYVYAPTGGGC